MRGHGLSGILDDVVRQRRVSHGNHGAVGIPHDHVVTPLELKPDLIVGQLPPAGCAHGLARILRAEVRDVLEPGRPGVSDGEIGNGRDVDTLRGRRVGRTSSSSRSDRDRIRTPFGGARPAWSGFVAFRKGRVLAPTELAIWHDKPETARRVPINAFSSVERGPSGSVGRP